MKTRNNILPLAAAMGVLATSAQAATNIEGVADFTLSSSSTAGATHDNLPAAFQAQLAPGVITSTASSNHGAAFPESALTDGSLATGGVNAWASGVASSVTLTLDFASADVAGVILNWGWANRTIGDYQVLVDGNSLGSIRVDEGGGTSSTESNEPNTYIIFDSVQSGATKIEVITSNGGPAGLGGYWGLDEIEVYTGTAGPDNTPPSISSLSPADDTADVAVDTAFVATFSENIALTATGTITVTDGSETRVVNLDGSADDGDASVLNDVLTITLDTDLTNNLSSYDVLISNDAIVDTAPAMNPFAGTVAGDWNFTTAAVDLTPPTIVPPTDPADDSTGVAVFSDFVATFSEPIALTATGTITVTDGSETRVVNLDGSADDGDASVLGDVLTITLDTDLTNLLSSYDVLISNDAIVDTAPAMNPFAGTVAGDWNFTTGTVGTWSSSPWADDADLTAYLSGSATYTHAIDFEGGTEGTQSSATIAGVSFTQYEFANWNNVARNGTDLGTGKAWSYTQTDKAYNGNAASGPSGTESDKLSTGFLGAAAGQTETLTLDGLDAHTDYVITLYNAKWDTNTRTASLDGLDDGVGNARVTDPDNTFVSYAYNTGASTSFSMNITGTGVYEYHVYAFTNQQLATGPDVTSPTIVPPTDPVDDSTGIAVFTNFVATFDEDIALTGTGTITVTDGSETRIVNLDGSADDGDASVVGDVLTITLDADLTNYLSTYDVLISSDAIVDTAAAPNPFAGTVAGDWNFTTSGPGGVWSSDPWADDTDLTAHLSGGATYTHAIDFEGGTEGTQSAATIAGVSFTQYEFTNWSNVARNGTDLGTGNAWSFTQTDKAWQGSALSGPSGTESAILSTGFLGAAAGQTETLTLDGLDAHTDYVITLYNAKWDTNTRTASLDGLDDGVGNARVTDPDNTFVSYAYNTGASTSFSMNITGTGVNEYNVYAFTNQLVVTGGGSSFDTWAGTGGLGPVTFGGDTNGDGVQDGIAFLLGVTNPDDDANGNLPVVTDDGSGGLVMTFDCLNTAARGTAVLNIEYSNDLGILDPWVPTLVPGAPGISADGSVDFVATEPGLIHVVATISAAEAAAGKLFGRLVGEQ